MSRTFVASLDLTKTTVPPLLQVCGDWLSWLCPLRLGGELGVTPHLASVVFRARWSTGALRFLVVLRCPVLPVPAFRRLSVFLWLRATQLLGMYFVSDSAPFALPLTGA